MIDFDWAFEVIGVYKVTDGDTFWLHLDVGFRQQQLTEIRLLDFDTPELYRPKSDFEREKAREAKAMVEEWFEHVLAQEDSEVWVRTEKDPDSFGRWLGEVVVFDSSGMIAHLGESLRGVDLASRWPTRWREEFDT